MTPEQLARAWLQELELGAQVRVCSPIHGWNYVKSGARWVRPAGMVSVDQVAEDLARVLHFEGVVIEVLEAETFLEDVYKEAG